MKISGFVEVSTIDYPEHLSCIVFFNGCNLRCPYCHNSKVVESAGSSKLEPRLLKHLDKMVGQLNGVVLSGGEPTLHDLSEFILWLKEREYDVKLDTNGTAVELRLMPWADSIDYFAVDLKLPADRYSILGDNIRITNLWSNLEYLQEHRKKFEVRTTVHRSLLPFEELERMKAEWIDPLGIRNWYLQQYVPEGGFDATLKDMPTYTDDQLAKIAIKLGARIRNVSQNLVDEVNSGCTNDS